MTTLEELRTQTRQAAEKIHAIVYPGGGPRVSRNRIQTHIETLVFVEKALRNAGKALDHGAGPDSDRFRNALIRAASWLRVLSGRSSSLPRDVWTTCREVAIWVEATLGVEGQLPPPFQRFDR